MKKVGVALITTAPFLLTPVLAFAQFSGSSDIGGFVENLTEFINQVLIPLIFAIALLAFLWGATKYFIISGGDPEKRSEGTQLMLYSVIGFVLMVSIFGIVNLIANGLGFSDDEEIQNIPNAPTSND